jgi:hypothetical protein
MSSLRLRRRTHWLAAAVLAAPALLAQDPTPAPVPAPALAPAAAKTTASVPVAFLHVAGPAQWRARFSPTNVGSLLESESGRALRVRTVAPVEAMLQQLLGFDDGTYAAARARLLDYAGALEATVWLGADTDDPIVVLRLAADGGTDLDKLAADLGALCEHAAGGHFAPAVDGGPRVLRLGEGGPWLSEPRRSDADFVAVIADDRALDRALQLLGASPATPRPRNQQLRPPLALRIDTAALVARQEARGTADKELQIIGVRSLGECTLELGTAGPHVMLELAHTFKDGERGLFGALFPDAQGLPAFAALAEPNDAGVKVGRADPNALYEPILGLMKEFDGDNAEKSMVSHLGTKDSGFLAQFTGEYLVFGAGEDPSLTGSGPDWGIALRIRDAAAMAAAWHTLRKEIGFTELETTDLGDGWQLQRLGGLVQLDVVIGKEMFAPAHGTAASDRLRALVTAAQKHDWSKPATAPARLQEVQRFAPAGWNGFGEGNVGELFAQVVLALQTLDEITGSLPVVQHLGNFGDEDRKALLQLLTEHHLQTAHSLTGYSGRRWCFRVIW